MAVPEKKMSVFPRSVFEDAMESWSRVWTGTLKQYAAAAAVKDFLALLEARPRHVRDSVEPAAGWSEQLVSTVMDTINFIKQFFLKSMFAASRGLVDKSGASALAPIVSPFAGSYVPEDVEQHAKDCNTDNTIRSVGIGCFNPGRSGLTALGSNSVLWWRLWNIAYTAADLGLSFIVLPGPRFPPDVTLPHGYPYEFWGRRSLEWDSVGILVAPEFAHTFASCRQGSDRRMWFTIESTASAPDCWILCAIYAPPGGDVDFWKELLSERKELLGLHPRARTVLVGDCNIHLTLVVDHDNRCRCSHCRQSAVDRTTDPDTGACVNQYSE